MCATSHSSSGLGHRPFTAVTGVRTPYGTPFPFRNWAGIAQLVEHNLAKVGVASSSLVSRSKIYTSHSSSGLGHRPFTAVTGVRTPYGTPFPI